jgi:hypothetical protein
MRPQHTPGPWHRSTKPITKYPVIFAGRNNHIAVVICHEGLTSAECEANADIIAAAPELFEFVMQIAYGRKPTMRVLPPSVLASAKVLVTKVIGTHVEIVSARRYYRRAAPGWVRLHDGVVVFQGTRQACEDFGS